RGNSEMKPAVISLLLAGILFLSGATVFGLMFYLEIITDIQYHAVAAQKSLATLHFPPHFLYFATLDLFAHCTSSSLNAFFGIATFVLGCAVAGKYCAAVRMARGTLHLEGDQSKAGLRTGVVIGLFLISFAHALPRTPLYYIVAGQPCPETVLSYFVYLGRTTCNIWHNSTTIFLMPFAVLLFYQTYLLLHRGSTSLPALAALIVLNVAAKPSFVMVMGVALPLIAFARCRLSRPFWYSAGAAAFGLALIGLQCRWPIGPAD